MIGHKLFPSRSGGVEVTVEALAVRMAEAGHRVTVYNRGKNPDSKAKFHKGVRIRSVPVIEKQGIAAVMGSFLGTLHAVFCGFDCIHYHAEGPAAFVWIPKLLGIRTVVTIHGLNWQSKKWGRFASWYLRQGEKAAARFADEVVVLSHAMEQYFLDTYGRRTVYIPNGVEPPRIRPADEIQTRWGLEKDNYILYLGRVVPGKGLDTLVKAYRNVNTDKKLVIAGGTETDEYITQLREWADHDERLIFTGFVQGQPLEELYSNCFLYCLPSEQEGMPISLLEAMGHHGCCVSSDIPECTEVLREYGYTFPNKDAAALRRLLQTLCDQPELVYRHRDSAAAYVLSRYNWEQTTEQTLRLYQKDKEISK